MKRAGGNNSSKRRIGLPTDYQLNEINKCPSFPIAKIFKIIQLADVSYTSEVEIHLGLRCLA
jgi:hypothetical protein